MKPQSYEINVDTLKSISHSSMEFSQNNLNISELIFNITEDEKALPLNDTDKIIVYFKKPDKTVVFQDKEIEILDKAKGKIKVLLTTQTLVKAGDVQGEISIERVEDGTKKRANTYGFSFKVRSSIASNESIESTNEFQVFDKILKIGEKFEDFEEEDFEGIIEAGAKAETALVKATENTNQIGILKKKPYLLYEYLKVATKVKLIGDSITAGVGATGHALSTNLIFTDEEGTKYFEPVLTSQSWANHFGNFLKKEYPSVRFRNVGIGGKSAKWANSHKSQWVDNNEDIVFIQLGTNDRWDSATIEEFKTNLVEFLEYVDQRSEFMVVMAAPPSQDYNIDGTLKPPYLRDMREINKTISEVCIEKDYLFISHFDMFFDYITVTGAAFDYLLETQVEGGSHPKDPGHELVWRNIQSKLKLKDSYETWEGLLGNDKYMIRNAEKLSTATLATDNIFRKGKTCVMEVSSSHSDIANFPGGASGGGGTFSTFKGYSNDLYTYQTYRVRQTSDLYIRHWDSLNTKWTPFVKFVNSAPPRESLTISNVSVPANSNATGTVSPTKFSLVASKVYAITPTTNQQGIVFSWSINATNNTIVFRFNNLTANPITIATFAFNISEVISA